MPCIVSGNTSTEDVISNLSKEPDVRILQDVLRGVYIVYNEKKLYNDIENLKGLYGGKPEDTIEGSNCDNATAIARLDNLKQVVKHIANLRNTDELFDSLTYTKAGKFPKNKKITLYLPDLKSTFSGEYFSQMEIALQLVPIEIMPTDTFSFNWDQVDDIRYIEVTDRASFTNTKRPENIINVDGTLHKAAPTKRNTYLKQDELQVGSSYTDAKGSEYLYLGIINSEYQCSDVRKCDGSTYSNGGWGQVKYAYLRVTKGVKKELEKSKSLYDFLYKRFEGKLLKTCWYWDEGLNNTESKKFTELNTVYFDEAASELKDMAFNFEKGTWNDYPNLKIYHNIKFSK